ncbi:uncharacterized protein LOC118408776 [Branchiostoma floridae]|uniref:Uncharacterized protein LOC118408776 n=1 Tax=Branchiostoma floridae TaxID=7739 RepID=A0A9J7HTP5_BRAFL|nr:uncharacterized protein LOC118408776 [Branchiostoma floridae]
MPRHKPTPPSNNDPKKRKYSSTGSQTDEELDTEGSDIKSILQTIKVQLAELATTKQQVGENSLHIVNIAKASQHLEDEVSDLKKKLTELSEKVRIYQENQVKYEREKVKSQHKQVQMEAQSRRENLIFYNVPEEPSEKPQRTEKLLTQILEHNAKIPGNVVKNIKFQRVHRLGRTRIGDNARPRPIIAKFVWFKDREMVRGAARNLKGTNFGIAEDFPRQIREVRKKLMPVLRAARAAQPPKFAVLNVDQLYIDGDLYTGPESKRPYTTT